MENKDQPLVSVIMNCYNGEKYLRESIDSVYAQTYDNWEIIFWDNASTDNSAEIAGSFNDKLKYYYGENYISLGAARNNAIEQCSGEYIAFLDCDDLWLPDKLRLQIPLFDKDRIGIVISNVIYFSSNNREKILYRFRKPPTGNVFEKLLENYYIAMPTVIIRIESLLSLDHWFDPRFNLIEDLDLFLRICYKWELGYVDSILSKYRIHNQSCTSKQREKNIIEHKVFLNKINGTIPGFAQQYDKQINCLNRNICWLEAQELAFDRNFKKATEKIEEYAFDSIKWFVKYSLLSIPYIRFKFIKRLLHRI